MTKGGNIYIRLAFSLDLYYDNNLFYQPIFKINKNAQKFSRLRTKANKICADYDSGSDSSHSSENDNDMDLCGVKKSKPEKKTKKTEKTSKAKQAKESKKKSKDDKKKDKRKSTIRLKPKRKAVRKAVIDDSSDENSDSDAPVAKHSKKASVSFYYIRLVLFNEFIQI